MRGIITAPAKQTAKPFLLAKDGLSNRGVEFDVLPYSLIQSLPRRPNRLARGLREDAAIRSAISSRQYDFLFMNAAASFFRQGRARTQIASAIEAGVRVYVHWRNCPWVFSNIEQRIGAARFWGWVNELNSHPIDHIGVSRSNSRDLEASLGVVFADVVHNCVDIPQESDLTVPDACRPLVLGVGSVQPRKGNDIFVEIAAEVCSAVPEARFLWVGGEANRELRNLSRTRHLEKQISFIPRVDDPRRLMRKASAVLCPSRSEAFGLVAAEAMSEARTVLAFEPTGLAEVVGDSGVLASFMDLQLLRDELVRLLTINPSDRVNRAAFERCRRLFSPDTFAARLEQLLSN